jgi:hypothetical protein
MIPRVLYKMGNVFTSWASWSTISFLWRTLFHEVISFVEACPFVPKSEGTLVNFYEMFSFQDCGFWIVTPCNHVGSCQRFGGSYRFYLQGTSTMLLTTYKTTWRHNPEDYNSKFLHYLVQNIIDLQLGFLTVSSLPVWTTFHRLNVEKKHMPLILI